MTSLKLTIELVPSPLWGVNLRRMLAHDQWDTLRRRVYRAYRYTCAICAATNTTMYCHECWEYDDITHVQRLKDLMALCKMCHHVKHLGHAGILAAEGELEMEAVVAHFMRVNDCDRATFEAHAASAFDQWSERSRYTDWTTDLGEHAALLKTLEAAR